MPESNAIVKWDRSTTEGVLAHYSIGNDDEGYERFDLSVPTGPRYQMTEAERELVQETLAVERQLLEERQRMAEELQVAVLSLLMDPC